MRTNSLWAIIGVLINHYGNSGSATPAQAPTCTGQATDLATSKRIYPSPTAHDQNVYQDSLCAPFSRLEFSCSASTSPVLSNCSDGGMEVQTMLEACKWTPRSLPTLWWTLGQGSRSIICPARAAIKVTEKYKISTNIWMGLAERRNTPIERKECFNQRPTQAEATPTKEEDRQGRGAFLCNSYNATTLP